MVGAAFWSFLGFAVGRHLLPRAIVPGAAPALGWAVQSAVSLPIFFLLGFSLLTVVGVTALSLVVGIGLMLARVIPDEAPASSTIPVWAYGAAALLALAPAAAIMPKFAADTVYFADAIFDHSKIAIIDAMTREGLPPVNPIFAGSGTPDRLVYYYLWHFSAAALALPLGASGWEADTGLTWFTAFASLTLMMGLAVWLSRRSIAAAWVMVLAAAASLWELLGWMFPIGLNRVVLPPIGMAGWLYQATWVPQHLAAASCVVVAVVLIARYAERQSAGLLVTLVLTIAAGFESSTYVGGVTFALGALVAVPILFVTSEPEQQRRFAVGMVVAAVLVACLVAPFVLDQLEIVKVRGGGHPVVFGPYAVFGPWSPDSLRRLLDLPGFWLILLPIELPASYVAGIIALAVLLRGARPALEKRVLAAFACLGGAGLCVSWLLVSTFGDNNDLRLRAIIPAAIVLIVAAAAGLTLMPRRIWIVGAALAGLVLSLPDTAKIIHGNVAGVLRPGGNGFAGSPELWDAVRRYAPPNARVANNPLFLHELTEWPANISWALLADRSSCFAGRELALAFAPLPPGRRDAIDEQFVRVFDGSVMPGDVRDLATRFGCEVVVVVPQDGAWINDPFAQSADYRLAEERDGKWRIYLLRR